VEAAEPLQRPTSLILWRIVTREGGACVREQQLRYRVAAQMGGHSSEVVRTIKQTAHTTWRRESVSLVGEGGVGWVAHAIRGVVLQHTLLRREWCLW
jgi:hypothetical protein